MSMNFYVSGSREITVNKTGVVEIQHIEYQPWQTPTLITNKILASDNPIESYKDWVKNISEDKQEKIYDDEDIFCDNNPIGEKTINAGTDECNKIDDWIKVVTDIGYELRFYTL